MTKKSDPLKPSISLLSKLGSIVVHAEEFISPQGHQLDVAALSTLLKDHEVVEWIKGMRVFIPVKR